jgi:hypothetical protein
MLSFGFHARSMFGSNLKDKYQAAMPPMPLTTTAHPSTHVKLLLEHFHDILKLCVFKRCGCPAAKKSSLRGIKYILLGGSFQLVVQLASDLH